MKFVVNKFILLSIASMMLFLSGCGGGEAGQSTASLKTGELHLSKMNGMAEVAAAVQGQMSSATTFGNISSATTFDLGTIKASQNYYFILSNAGDIPVTDVVITTDNDNFVVSPNKIDVISPQNNNYIIPVIKVGATHGVSLNGVGYTDSLLPMGNNECTINVSGKTKDKNGNVIGVNINAKLKIYSEVVNIELHDGNNTLDMSKPLQTTWFSTYLIKQYQCMTPTIVNSGNVDISITNYQLVWGTVYFSEIEKFILKPNESRLLNYPKLYTNNGYLYKTINLKIDGSNTITNYNSLQLQSDGNTYISITNLSNDLTHSLDPL
jgi:hypothetical protein